MKKSLTIFFSLLLFLSMINRVKAEEISFKPFIELQAVYSAQDGKKFDIKPILDTKGNTITKIDLYIGFNPSVITIVDADTTKNGVQIEQTNQFGTVITDEYDVRDGILHLTFQGSSSKEDIQLGTINFEVLQEGNTDIEVLNNTEITAGNQILSFQSSHAVISQIINDYKGYRLSHIQSTFLGAENVNMPIDASFYTKEEITEFIIQYRKIALPGEETTWRNLSLESINGSLHQVVIPAEDVQQPGILYCFKVRTPTTFTTMPRPCTLENAYKMQVVDQETLQDTVPPTLTFTPEPGTYDSTVSVTVSVDEKVPVYCTTNSLYPTERSPLYEKPIVINDTTNLRCFAKDVVGNRAVKSGTYDIAGSIKIEFTAEPAELPLPGNATLKWNVTGAEIVNINKEIGDVNLSGETLVSLTDTTIYTLTAKTSEKIKTQDLEIKVGQAPSEIYISANKTIIQPGESVELQWSAVGLTDPVIGPDVGIVEEKGIRSVTPLKTTTYILTGLKNGQAVEDSVTVQVALDLRAAATPITGPKDWFLGMLLAVLTTLGILYCVVVRE